MKRAWLSLGSVALSLVCVSACSGGGLKPGGDSAVPADLSATSDQSMPKGDMPPPVTFDLAGLDFKGVSCGSMTCGTGQSCCAVASGQGVSQMCVTGDTCSDGGIDVTCDGPEDCSGGGSSCCADISIGGGGGPNGGAMCTASCPASASAGGGSGGMIETKLCHSPADCTNYSGTTPIGTLDFDSCCTYTGVSYRFCAPGIITGFVMGISCD